MSAVPARSTRSDSGWSIAMRRRQKAALSPKFFIRPDASVSYRLFPIGAVEELQPFGKINAAIFMHGLLGMDRAGFIVCGHWGVYGTREGIDEDQPALYGVLAEN